MGLDIVDSVLTTLRPFAAMPVTWFVIALGIVVAVSRIPAVKGWFGEMLVRVQARLLLPKDRYTMIGNVTVPDSRGGTTQIDHVVVSRYGVFVIETKNMKGWIFGAENDPTWTQKIHGGHSQAFQNPLRQNFKHTRTLAELLGLSPEQVVSCIAFVGSCTLKTRDKLPANVGTNAGWATFVKEHREELLTEADVRAVLERLEQIRLKPGLRTHREHVNYVKGLREEPVPAADPTVRPGYSPETGAEGGPAAESPSASGRDQTEPACPHCGGKLVQRVARRGPKKGQSFTGCSNFPRCSHVA